ncbi:MAG: DUF3999 domain-containing protein [gamma proteobacterium symbiont of Taylorina sp.]|nr:DUF3999 domain-containing protein [gamma proteobacterium symbiont of Taylorina sp.]
MDNLKSSARHLNIILPEINIVVRVQVLSRSGIEQTWHHRGSVVLYRLIRQWEKY